jgi:hypothetical protein
MLDSMALTHLVPVSGLRHSRATRLGQPGVSQPGGDLPTKGGASPAGTVLLALLLAGALHCGGYEPCDTGSLRCQGTRLQACYPDDWITVADCASTGQVCSASEPACVDPGESGTADRSGGPRAGR